MPVYIFAAGDLAKVGIVKIGWSLENPEGRRRAIQTAHWLPITIIRLIDAPEAAEKWLHRYFSEHRIAQEWFRFHPDMLSITVPTLVPSQPMDAGIQLLKQQKGGVPSVAKACGISRQAIFQWKIIPAEHVVRVEAATGIPRHLLRPDLHLPPSMVAA